MVVLHSGYCGCYYGKPTSASVLGYCQEQAKGRTQPVVFKMYTTETNLSRWQEICRMKMCVDWSKIDKRDYLDAMIATHTTDSSKIRELLRGALTDKIDDREIFMKGIGYSYYYEQTD